MIEKEKYICELCKKEINKTQIVWQGTFVLCEKCLAYLKRKGK